MERKKAVITGDILKAKAHEIRTQLPQYSQQQEPGWSNGWLDRFKKRHNIEEYKLHGEGLLQTLIVRMQSNRWTIYAPSALPTR